MFFQRKLTSEIMDFIFDYKNKLINVEKLKEFISKSEK